MSTGGPNYANLYLTGRIQPGHPMFAELDRMYGPTPEGKRLTKFNEDNTVYLDGLQRLGPAQLDMIMRTEGIMYTGNPDDRIMKISTIRAFRDRAEETNLSSMTNEEKDAYFVTKRAQQDIELASQKKVMELQGGTDQAKITQHIDKAAQIRERREKYLRDRQVQRDLHNRQMQEQGDASAARAGTFVHPLAAPSKEQTPPAPQVDEQATGPVKTAEESAPAAPTPEAKAPEATKAKTKKATKKK